jgi:hypothetical protein
MRYIYTSSLLVIAFLFASTELLQAQCACANGNNPNGAFIIGPGMTPTVACYDDLLAALNDNMSPFFVSAFDTDDGFIPVCIVSAPPANNCVGMIMITVDAVDSDDNCSSNGPLMISVMISDNIPPTIDFCPADIAIDCSDDLDPTINLALGEATATDNCSTPPIVTYGDAPVAGVCIEDQVITRTWTATDACGLTATCAQVITVTDDINPTFDVPADITIFTDAMCDYDADTLITGVPTNIMDNCDMAPNVSFADVITMTPCGMDLITRTWTIEDECGNLSIAVQVITVEDNIDPVITNCPADGIFECDNFPGLGDFTPDATDNCDPFPMVVGNETILDGFCNNYFTITRTWTATDRCGNTSSCVQILDIQDTTDPVITCPSGATVECDGDFSSAALGFATATDNCQPFFAVMIDEVDAVISTVCTGTYVIERTWTAYDECGNTSTCVQTINIQDTTAPDISTCQATDLNLTLECDGFAGNLAAANQWNLDNITYLNGCALDACGIVSISSDYAFANLSDECGETGTMTVTYTIMDDCMNAVTIMGTLIIEDTTDPDLSGCVQTNLDESIECSGIGNYQALADTWNADNITYLDGCATDNCGGVVITSDYDFNSFAGSCGEAGSLLVTYTITDECGRTNTIQGTFTITDNTPPVITLVGDATIELCLDATYNDAGATASDVCDGDVTGDIITDNPVNTMMAGTYIVTYNVADACGNNAIEVTRTVIVNANPTFEFTAQADPGGTPQTGNNYGGPSTINIDFCTTEDLSLSGFTRSGVDVGFTLTTSSSGNVEFNGVGVAVGPVVNNVSPAGAPAFFNATYGDYDLSSGTSGTITQTYEPYIDMNNNGTYEAGIDCIGDIITVEYTIYLRPDAATANKTICSGAQTSLDVTNPNGVAGATFDWTANYGAVTGGLGNDSGISFGPAAINETLINATNAAINVIYTITPVGPGPRFCPGAPINVTVTVDPQPAITCPVVPMTLATSSNGTGDCTGETDWTNPEEENGACGPITLTLSVDGDPAMMVLENDPYSTGPLDLGVHTFTYEVTDGNGNTNTCSFTVEVVDDETPVITTCPVTRNIEGCDENAITGPAYSDISAGSTYAEFSDGTNQGVATDNCPIQTVTYQDAAPSGTCPMEVIRTWTISDGTNSTSCTQTIVINDTTDPDLSGCVAAQLDDTHECTGAGPNEIAADAWDAANIALLETCAFEACMDITVSSDYDFANLSDECGETGSLTVTYTVEDACGNSNTIQGTFTIVDTTPPTWDVAPMDGTVECGPGDGAAFTAWLTSYAGAMASDACSAMVTLSSNGLMDVPGCGETHAYSLNVRATDECTNFAEEVATFNIIDNTPPVITLVGDATIELCLDATYNDAGATASDACEGDVTAGIVTNNPVNTAIAGTYIVTYNVSDDCGNDAIEVTRTVIVNANPTFEFTAQASPGGAEQTGNNYGGPSTINIDFCTGEDLILSDLTRSGANVGFTLNTSSSGNVEYNGAGVPIGPVVANVSPVAAITFFDGTYGDYDLSSGTSGTITQTYEPYIDMNNNGTYEAGIDCIGDIITVEYTIYLRPDASAANKTICSGAETSLEVTNPNTVPGATFEWTAVYGAVTGGAGLGSGSFGPDAIDETLVNATNAAINVVYTITPIGPAPRNCEGTPIDVTVTVEPQPAITCPVVPMTLATSSNGTGDCTGETVWTNPEEENGACGPITLTLSVDGGAAMVVIEDDPYNTGPLDLGVHTFTYEVTDGNGNTNTCSFTVEVVDDETPVITTCPVTRTVEGCDENAITGPAYSVISAASSYVEFSDGTNQGVATDNCPIQTVTYQDDAPLGTCPMVVVRTWTVSDGTNSTSCTQTIYINDTTDPDLSSCDPALLDATHECTGAAANEMAADAWDAANITLLGMCAFESCSDVTVSSDYDFSNLSDECGETGSLTVTYTVEDTCGNESQITGTFTIVDTTPPTWDVAPTDGTVECGPGDAVAFTAWLTSYAGASASDVCSPMVTLSSNGLMDVPGCGETHAYSLNVRATDECTNFVQEAVTFNILDNTPPVITLIGDATIELCLDATYNDAGATASDVCDGDVTADIATNNPVNTALAGTYIVTYNVSDDCGNDAIEVTRTVIVYADPTFEFTAQASPGGAAQTGNNYSGPSTINVDFCTTEDLILSNLIRSGSNVGFTLNTSSSGNVEFDGVGVPVGPVVANVSPAAAITFFDDTYGDYDLSSGTSGTIIQTYEPYIDLNNNGTYDAGDCLGDIITIEYTIYLRPDAVATNDTICSGEETSIEVTNPNAVPGATFDWTATYGGVTGGAGSGSGSFGPNAIDETLFNLTNAPIEVVYTITPVGPAPRNCPGTPIDITITVDPVPVLETSINGVVVTANNDGMDDTGSFSVCNDPDNVTFNLFSDLTGIVGNVKAFQVVQGGVNVAYSYCTNCAAPLSAFTNLVSTLSLVDPTMGGSLVMRFRAWDDLDDNNSVDADECPGDWIEYTITVNPLPQMVCPADLTICVNGGAFTLTGESPVGGTFSGPGISGNDFDPSVAGVGVHVINYSYTDGNNCTDDCDFEITVEAVTVVTCPADQEYCIDAGIQDLSALGGLSPLGGTFSGQGVSGNDFDPAGAGAGAFVITYIYVAGNGCSDTCEFNITVHELPIVTCPADQEYCLDAGIQDLSVLIGLSPAGGTFSGVGVSGNDFDPVAATVGTYTITYTYVDGNGCDDICSFDITVHPLPVVTCPADQEYCIDAGIQDLSLLVGLSPSGGIFSGVGISGNNFDPAVATAGTYTITYTYTDGNGCDDFCVFDITVHPLPVVICPSDEEYCIDEGIQDLSALPGLSPIGGTFSGAGVTGSDFDPAMAGVGTHTITYTYTDGNGCDDFCEFDITVNPLPVVTCPADQEYCIDAGLQDLSLLGGLSPAGGVFTGVGVSGNDFDPAAATAGTYTITYTYTDGNGCVDFCEFEITVHPLPLITCPADQEICIDRGIQDLSALAGLSPAGGTFSGAGVSGNDFDPTVAGLGTHVITYSFTDGNGCTSTCDFDIIVHDIPVLETNINGVIVTANNDGVDDLGSFTVCNETNNINFISFSDLAGIVGNVKAFQVMATLTNVTVPFCNNCAALLGGFAGVNGTAALIDPYTDGTLVMRFRAWTDANDNNVVDPQECVGDWIEYTITIRAEIELTCAVDQTEVACQDQAAIDAAFDLWLLTTTFTGGENPVMTNDNTGAPDACGGSTIVTWTVTSDCEADVTCSATFTVTPDNTDPTFTVPTDVTIYSDANCGYDSDLAFTGDVFDEDDDCSTGLEATYSDATAPGSCEGEVIITRTWSLVDNCGNAALDQIQTITVQDNIVPTFTVSIDVTIFSDASCNYDVDVAFTGDVTDEDDNCSNALVATYNDVASPGSCEGEVIITRTWSLVDDCGNTAVDQVQTITVQDNLAPTFTIPVDVTIYSDVNCAYDADIVFTGDVTDEADNCSTGLDATYSDATAAGNCEGEVIITRTWSLVDDCGNTAGDQVQTITVQDTIVPTFTVPIDVTIFSDANCGYDSDVVFTGDVTDEADNCTANPDATFSDATAPGSCEGEVIITRTWSLVDNCGNAAVDQIQTITVQDNIVPTFTVPIDVTIFSDASCNYDSDVAFTGDVTDEDDNCSNALVATYNDVSSPGSCEGEVIITRTWSLVDDCGNTAADQVQTITVQDNLAPTFTIPVDVTIYSDVNCAYDADIVFTGDVTDEADNCSTGLDATYSDATAAGNCEGEVIITRTWSLVDDCGNTAGDQVQTITVQDTIVPTFTVPIDVTIFSDANCGYDSDVVFTGDVTDEADNCTANPDATFSDATAPGSCEGEVIITRTWSLVDNCGNAAVDQIQTITVQDNIVPTFTVPIDVTIFSDASCNYDSDVAFTGDVTDEDDNCSNALVATYNDVASPGSCEGEVIITRTWSLVDDCGNTAVDQVQTITVQDNLAPTFTIPVDVTIYSDVNCAYDADIVFTGDVTDEADNCSTGLDATYSDATAAGNCEGEVIITRTWSLVDDCGNTAGDQVQTITVQDTIVPTFTVPIDVTIFSDANCGYDSDVVFTGDVTDEADNCTANPDATFSDATAPGSCEGEVIITRTWSLVDNCGNAAVDQIQTITVQDNIVPTFTVPIDVTIFSDASCNYDADVAFTGDVTDEDDNCSNALVATYNDVASPGSCEGEVIITRTWSLVDDCGNTAVDQVQTITVQDNLAPTFTIPVDVTIYSDVNCAYDADIVFTGDVTDEADNCSTGLDATYSDATAAGNCEGEVIITRTWSLVDDCGNTAGDQVQTITVQDTIVPTFTVPIDVTIFSDANCGYDSDVVFTGDVTDEADNCTANPDATFSDATAPGSCEGEVIITRTWSLVDNCGNAAVDQIQTITVQDNIVPTFTVPIDVTIFSDASCNYDADVAFTGDVTDEDDNCTADPQATYSDAAAPGSCEGEVIITRTWSLVDDCGNTAADQVQTITVQDNIAPTFTVPVDITIFSDANCSYDADVVFTGDVTDEDDNCSTGLDATYSDATAPGSCEGEVIITRTWSLVDDCGNTAGDQIQTITVQDNVVPSFTVPVDVTIFSDAACAYNSDVAFTGDVLDEADNCTADPQATYSDATAPGSCEGEVIITRTWSLVDDCGNAAADQIQTITVQDNISPTFTAPIDVTIFSDASCNYDADVAFTGDVTDEDDNCTVDPQATYSDATAPGSCEGEVIITRTWSLIDDCGNTAADQVQTITVQDNIVPTFTVPVDITIFSDANCSYDADVVFTGDVTDEDDNCSTGLDATYSDATAPGSCEGEVIITRTWSLVDDCGNTAGDQSQTITVQDNIVPTFTVPVDITIFSDAACAYDSDVAFTGDVTDEDDNCTADPQATYSDATAPGSCEGEVIITRTWSLVDDCGNAAADQVQTITVQDNISPTFTAPIDVTIFSDASCNYDADVAFTGDVTDEDDNCTADPQATYSDATAPGSCEGEVIITRTWSLVDDCGNTAADQVQTITVQDNIVPTFTVPVDITIFSDANCSYDADVVFTGDVTDEDDNCSTGLDATYSDAAAPGNCEGEVIITRTWTLTDDCGNTTVQTQIITVADNTPPTFTQPADITIYKDVNCDFDAMIGFTGDVTDEDDNCTTILEATFMDDVQPGITCVGEEIITRTWSLVDDCGNVTTHNQIITAIDTIRPVFPKPDDITLSTEDDGALCPLIEIISIGADQFNPVATGNAPFIYQVHDVDVEAPTIYSDNCSSGANLRLFVWSIDPDYGGAPYNCIREFSIIYRVYDGCGNYEEQQQIITIIDNSAPTFTAPDDITIYTDNNCAYNASVGVTGDVTDEMDNCQIALVATSSDDIVAGSCEGELIITRTWMLVDDCGNAADTQVQIITVKDNTVPTFTRPNDITIFSDANCDYDSDVAFTGDVTDEDDNCTADPQATYSDATAPGSCEGEVIITRTWSLVDDCGNNAVDQVQTITVQDNIIPTFTRPVDITIFSDANCAYDADVAFTGDVTDEDDNCTADPQATYSDATAPGNCEGEVIITRTWSLVDDCGNAAADQVQTITVQDNIDPTFTRPDDITIFSDANCNYDSDVAFTGDVTDEADNCSTGIEAVYTDDAVPGSCEGEVIITRTWTLTDNCGNTADTQVQTITVQDNIDPTFTRPDDITIFSDANCNYDSDVAFTGDVIDEADNCSTGIEAVYTDDAVPGSCEGEVIITRTWTLTDNCGNTADTQVQTITVQDNILPMITCPADVVVECSDDHSSDALGKATATDNCDPNPIITEADFRIDGFCTDYWTIERTWTATDDCGNTQTCLQTITVEDTTPPVANCQDVTIYLDEFGNVTLDPELVNDGSNDNCDQDVTLSVLPNMFTCANVGPNLVVLTVEDNCGNSTTCEATVTVLDTVPPNALCKDVMIFLDANGLASISVPDIDNGSNDACGIASLVLSRTDYFCSDLGDVPVTLTVTDVNNNVSTCIGIVMVRDIIPPTALCKDYVIELNQQGVANLIPFMIDNGSFDNCNVILAVSPTQLTCSDVGLNIVQLTVTDPAGNSAVCFATVKVEDNSSPTMACKNLTLYLNAQGDPISILPSDIDNGSFDNCGIVSLTINKSLFDCSTTGNNVVKLTAIDPSGNESACYSNVTVLDTILPVWTFLPADVTVYCVESAATEEPEATDNCDAVQVTLHSEQQELWPGGPTDSYRVRRIWHALDGSGNLIVYEQFVYVLPGGELFVNCVGDIVTPETNIPIPVTWPIPFVDDICDGKDDMYQIGGPAPGSYFNPGSETIITYEYTDDFGTRYQCAFWVIVPNDSSDYALILNEQDCANLQKTSCAATDLPAPDNYSFELIPTSQTPIRFDLNTFAQFETFADGSARLRGSWTDAPNNCGWDMDIWFHRRRTHDGWLAAGGQISNFNLGDPKTWDYFEVDGSRSTMTGTGCNAGQTYDVTVSPNFPKFGFQLGNGANTKTTPYGGWVIIGIRNQANEQLIAQGIFSFELACINTNRLKDAASVISLDGFNYPVKWSNGVVGPNLGDVPAGLYHVTITDQNGKDSIAHFILEFPTDCELYYDNNCRPGNIAEGKNTKQSSTFMGATAGRAIDGNTDGLFANGSVTSTLAGFQNWWSLDLIIPDTIETIRVWNRTDECCKEVLDPFWVFVSDSPIPEYGDPDSIAKLPWITAFYHSGPVEEYVDFAISEKAQYVKVQLDQFGRLTLAEVQVLVCQKDKVGIKVDALISEDELEAEVMRPEIEQIPDVKPWPNPASNLLELEVQQQTAQPVTISVMNLQGMEMYRIQLPAEKMHRLTLDVGSWAPGMYFMTTTSPVGARSQQISIQR